MRYLLLFLLLNSFILLSHSKDSSHASAEWQIEAYGTAAPDFIGNYATCLLYTSPSPRDKRQSRMPSSA